MEASIIKSQATFLQWVSLTSTGATGSDLALTCLGWQKPPSWVTAWHTQTSSTLPTLSPLGSPQLFRELRPEPT